MPEIGYQTDSGLLGWAALADDNAEQNPKLRWPLSIDEYDRMRREDAQVQQVLRAVNLPIQRNEWVIDGTGCREEVTRQIAEDLGLPVKGQPPTAPKRTKGRFSFGEHLRLALLEGVFGHSVFEQVYDQSTGRARLAKLSWRPPRTISDFEVAADGGLVAIKQHGRAGKGDVRIPVDRLVVYVNAREGSNWTGASLLRSAYKPWLLKDRGLRIQSLAGERNGVGIPTYTGAPVPEGATPEQREEWLKSERENGLRVVRAFRAGDEAGAVLTPGAKLELLAVTGELPDTEKPIRYYDEQISGAVLANFLNLGGNDSTGSYALGDTFANFFTDSLNAVCMHIADVLNQHVIEDLVDANWGPEEPAPRIVPSPIGSEHPVTGEAIRALVECGALTATEDLEEHLRSLYRLPVLPTDAVRGGKPTEAERARFAAETAQKVYLATNEPPLRQDEAREIIRAAGADLSGQGPTRADTAPKEDA